MGTKLERRTLRLALSAALLSKLERGKLFPTRPTLLRIAMVFGVGLDTFLTENSRPDRERRRGGVLPVVP
ncbi:MAG TPA: hypothetical protein VNO32_26855 [Candidatus Acidoferrum sp.]|nr:hypothetical protein [Candidatus Acidoferrum sp.]